MDEISIALNSFYDDVLDRTNHEPTTYELVVVDTAVEGYQQLVEDILRSADSSREFELVTLDSSSSGVEQLTEILSSRRGIDALHLVSHGSDGSLQLGNSNLNGENLDSFENQIADWKYSLSRDADILIYGCEVAKTDFGEVFLEQLAELTESDVAASQDITGTCQSGWRLGF